MTLSNLSNSEDFKEPYFGPLHSISEMGAELPVVLPRVLIVSRRTVRKNKFVDFVGEHHLDLIVRFGAVPVIVPRIAGLHSLLDSFEPIHGVLLCEGEDIDPSLYQHEGPHLSPNEHEEIRRTHVSDTAIDKEKDSIEFALAKLCLRRSIPFLGICRGSQVLNVACGGTLYQDIGTELGKRCSEQSRNTVLHIDYENYDNHRHPLVVLPETPLRRWFAEKKIWVNSYHHQGVNKLADRFMPMAFAPDGLVEGFYDPDVYDPQDGKFLVGLQFHPERMRQLGTDQFDYPGCVSAYQEFVTATIAFKKKLGLVIQQQRDYIVRREAFLSCERVMGSLKKPSTKMSSIVSRNEEKKRLKKMGMTVRNSYSSSIACMESNRMVKNVMEKMTSAQLLELVSFHTMMGQMSAQILDTKLAHMASNLGL